MDNPYQQYILSHQRHNTVNPRRIPVCVNVFPESRNNVAIRVSIGTAQGIEQNPVSFLHL